MESAREARRRKILERGSERLAFIAGQSQSLTPSSSFSSPRPPTLQPQQHPEQENPRSTTTTAGVEAHKHQPIDQDFNTEVEDDKELLPEHDADRELSGHETSSEFAKCKMGKRFQGGIRKEPAANAEQDGKIAEPSTGPIAHISSDQVVDRAPYANSPMIHQVLTSKQISRAISASENIRLLCAVGIALLVVMSSRGYSLGATVLGTIPNFRPLCLVLLTDTTVIIGHLFVSRKSCSKDGEEARRTRQEEFGLANNIGSALEIGLVFQKALNAAFMDCSICAVIMISGLLL
ncbi:uncharacterized protein LOC103720387 isoform X2 [Phoenix dactylifera]|uniref:Uncharacterized protein LOC103720387 isoform X2 n=1 Tax=Phoenix dactylifera TaxID=42345 RepID=A0A8B7CX69_PHODC|nr:uncharacterized protein LOC103720387 isoform X2 [Phoenix dactylifera]